MSSDKATACLIAGPESVAGGEVSISTAAGCKAGTAQDGGFKFLNVPSGAATLSASKGIFNGTAQATPGTPAQLKISPSAVHIGYVPGSFDRIEDVVTRLLAAAPGAADIVARLEAELPDREGEILLDQLPISIYGGG